MKEQKLLEVIDEYNKDKYDFVVVKKAIRNLRERQGLKPKDFVGVFDDINHYYQLEKMSFKYKPSIESVIKVCVVMDVEVEELIGEMKRVKEEQDEFKNIR